MDFTLSTYGSLVQALRAAGYSFLTMEEYAARPADADGRVCVMRHDVDLHAERSLRMAELEHQLGVRAVYYFRVVPQSNQPDIIRAIAALGHEIGYHYEDMSICDGREDEAYAHFCRHLDYFRSFYPVRTICMHGAPTSRYDGRDLWRTRDYHALGIICEPYLDLDYSRLLYLTDTGRRWDGYRVSLRDRIPVYQEQWQAEGLSFHSTADIIASLADAQSPLARRQALLLTTHPQRWTDSALPWLTELLTQSLKNVVKRALRAVRAK